MHFGQPPQCVITVRLARQRARLAHHFATYRRSLRFAEPHAGAFFRTGRALDVFDARRFADRVVGVVRAHPVRVDDAREHAFGVVGRGERTGGGIHQLFQLLGGRAVGVLLIASPFVAAVAHFFEQTIVFRPGVLEFCDVAVRVGIAFELPKRVVDLFVIVFVFVPTVVLCFSSAPVAAVVFLGDLRQRLVGGFRGRGGRLFAGFHPPGGVVFVFRRTRVFREAA